MSVCFQHPDQPAEVDLRFYDDGKLVTLSLCAICQYAASIEYLERESLISPDYEIVEIENTEVGG